MDKNEVLCVDEKGGIEVRINNLVNKESGMPPIYFETDLDGVDHYFQFCTKENSEVRFCLPNPWVVSDIISSKLKDFCWNEYGSNF